MSGLDDSLLIVEALRVYLHHMQHRLSLSRNYIYQGYLSQSQCCRLLIKMQVIPEVSRLNQKQKKTIYLALKHFLNLHVSRLPEIVKQRSEQSKQLIEQIENLKTIYKVD